MKNLLIAAMAMMLVSCEKNFTHYSVTHYASDGAVIAKWDDCKIKYVGQYAHFIDLKTGRNVNISGTIKIEEARYNIGDTIKH